MRYAADPKTLWSWFDPYVKDEEVLKGVMLLLSIGIWYFSISLEFQEVS